VRLLRRLAATSVVTTLVGLEADIFRCSKPGQHGAILLHMRAWGLAFLVVSLVASSGCTSTPQRLAQLELSSTGGGSVTVLRFIDDPACEGGICGGGLGNAGSTSMAYEPGTDVTLIAQPTQGSQFVSWQITIYWNGGPSGHEFSTTLSSEATLVVHNTGEAMDVLARFEGDASEAGPDAGAADSANE
jgi:hypothetical protein